MSKDVERHVRAARESLRRALDICSKEVSKEAGKGTKKSHLAGRWGADIATALNLLGERASRYRSLAAGDPDIFPDDLKYPGWHKRGGHGQD